MKSTWKKMLFVDGIFVYMIAAVLSVSYYREQTARTREGMPAFGGATEAEAGVAADPYREMGKRVALTFDDGPNPYYTEPLLAGLSERGVKATFFLLGKEVEKHPEIVEEIQKQGHIIGNHSYQHEQLSRLSDEAACGQVERTNELIHGITGEYPLYLRPPYGDWKDGLDCETIMIEVLWDVDPRDWATSDTAAVVKRVTGKVQDGDIILMHDASESSVKAALEVVDRLKAEGYQFVTVEELLLE